MTTAPLAPDCLIAVATKTGQQIDMHFGHADDFAIYAVCDGVVTFLEKREVEHYCQGGHGDEDKREVILRALADCRALFVARIGGGPGTQLREAGIEPVDDYPYGAPEPSIAAWLTSRNG